MFQRSSEHRPQIRVSAFKGASIDGGLEFQGRLLGGEGCDVGGFEPAIFLDLMIGHGFQRRFGAHHDHGLEFAVDFPGFAPDEKLADIKFRHVAAFP